MVHRLRSAVITVALVAGASMACSKPSSTETTPPPQPACSPEIASIQEKIFLPSCAQSGCHGQDSPAAALDLTGGDVQALLVGIGAGTCDGKTLVVPGQPEASFLYEKLTTATPSCGAHMPLSGALTAEQKACVKEWIADLEPPDGGSGASDGGSGGGDAGCETCGTGKCVDTKADPAHCGSCEAACSPGSSCTNGACACSGGLAACGGKCVDTLSDPASCGGCAKACPTGALCNGGACACPSGGMECGSACVDATSDPLNCGGCGKLCAAGEVCKLGACSSSCGTLTKCGASCVDTMTSATSCGACGKVCSLGASCVAGACQCPAGTSDCNGQCLNTASDPANCGSCGKVCAQGTTCQASACVCPGGGTVCGAACVDTQTDTSNCGACGNTCAAGQTCSAGVCTCGAASVSFAMAVQPIFTASCAQAGCHKGIAPQQGLDLSAGKAYADLVNVTATQCSDQRKRVLPGQPSQSYLIDKLMNVDICFGTRMPKTTPLPAAQINTIAAWICEGAPNN